MRWCLGTERYLTVWILRMDSRLRENDRKSDRMTGGNKETTRRGGFFLELGS
jgi:hypothetical protein